MVPDKYRLDSIGRFLIAAFERRRPALEAWTPAVEEELRAESEQELQQMERQCVELGVDDPPYWLRVRGALQAVLLPRYAALARAEVALSRRDYGLWRGGDLIARLAFAGTGLLLGGLAVAIPWIPVTEKWVPWALFVAGPFLPDAYFWWYRRRYRKRLEALVDDLASAGRSLDTYRPLSELQRALGEPASQPALSFEAPPARAPASAGEGSAPDPPDAPGRPRGPGVRS
ncbi:MAG: hypothetical protein NVSMB23_19360 [Myxococcales bacterium]